MASSPAPDAADERDELQWSWVAGLLILGAGIVALGFVTEDRWGWNGLGPSAFLEIGIAVGLAGVLVGLEQQIVRKVRSQTEAAQQRLGEQAGRLEHLFENLTQATEERLAANEAALDDAIGAVRNPTFDHVTMAMADADRDGALPDGWAVVQATPDIDGPRVVFRIGLIGVQVDPSSYVVDAWEPWERDRDGVDVGAALLRQLGAGGDPNVKIEWTRAWAGLQRTIQAAVGAQRGGENDYPWRHLNGRFYELAGDDWVVTSKGIEAPARTREVVLSADEFYAQERFGLARVTTSPPPPPKWSDDAEWRAVIRRGLRYLEYGVARSATGVPITFRVDRNTANRLPKRLPDEWVSNA